jgi:hypothetical protein
VADPAISASFSGKNSFAQKNVSRKNSTVQSAVNCLKANTIILPISTAEHTIIVTPAFKTIPAAPPATVRMKAIPQTASVKTAKTE